LSNTAHDSTHAVKETPGPSRVPRGLFVIIILCLAALYGWAVYGDTPAPEKTVKNFYAAYFDRNYETVSQNLSVFWAARFLPEYAEMDAAELVADRANIEKGIAGVIGEIEAENQLPEGLSIEIMKDYTKIGEKSAIVVYEFKENNEVTSKEAAILIMENGQFRIFNMSAIDDSALEQIKNFDMKILDENFTELLTSPESE